jgi:hypothetical protein
MKRFSGTAILTAVVLGIAVATYFLEYKKGVDEDQKKDQDSILFLGFNENQITHIELKGSKDFLVLDNTNQTWSLTSPLKDLADPAAIERFLNQVIHEKIHSVVAEGPQVDLKTFGLDQPATSLLLKTTKLSRKLNFGSVKAFDASEYAQIGDERKVLSVSGTWESLLAKSAFDLRLKNLYREKKDIPWDELEIVKNGTPVVHLKRIQGQSHDSSSGEWTLTIPKSSIRQELNSKAVETYMQQLKDLRAIEFVFEKSAGEAAQKREEAGFKLDRPYLLVTLKDSKDQKTWSLKVSSPTEAKKPESVQKKRAAHELTSVFVSSSDCPAIARVFASMGNAFDKKPQDFIRIKPAATATPDVKSTPILNSSPNSKSVQK